MEKPVTQIYEIIQKLIGFHRQLLDIVRAERQALIAVDVKVIQDITSQKQGIIALIQQMEIQRQIAVGDLALLWKKPARDLTLPNIIIAVQGNDQKFAEQLRSTFNALTILIQRITDANNDNRTLVERSLEHCNEMKRNVLGEAVPRSSTYASNGQKVPTTSGARLISKEV